MTQDLEQFVEKIRLERTNPEILDLFIEGFDAFIKILAEIMEEASYQGAKRAITEKD